MPAKIQVLFLASNPALTSSLQLDEEIRDITQKVRASDARDLIEIKSLWAVRPDDLLQGLNEHRPTIVHFSGHGDQEGAIVLMDQQRLPVAVSDEALRALFVATKDAVRLVVLNACYSEDQALTISEVVDAVVGMNDAIGDQAARVFAASFYRAIGFGRSVQEAFDQGRVALMLEGIREENTPVLLCEGDASSMYLLPQSGHRTPNAEGIIAPAQGDLHGVAAARTSVEEVTERVQAVMELTPLSTGVIFIDIDGFAGVNYKFGSTVGDTVLENVLALLHEVFAGGFIALLGSDEFVICMPAKFHASLEKKARTVVQQICQFPWDAVANGLFVTASAGTAMRTEGEHAEHLLLRAALGLRAAKRKGTNRVEKGPYSIGNALTPRPTLHNFIS